VTDALSQIPAPTLCPRCGTGLAPGLLRCPACRALVYADVLVELSRRADATAAEGRLADATHLWHEVLALLPPDAAQGAAIDAKLEALGQRMERGEGRAAAKPAGTNRGVWAAVGAGFLFLLTKGKVLLLALTKGGALLSVFAFLGVYWAAWGWAFALGILVSIYIHELGHVVALKRYGVPVSAPMFVPGLGAFVRHGVLPTARIGARVALAGPAAGLLAAAMSLGLFLYTGNKYWGAIAHLGAIINLGNLIPVWQLDGARAVTALDLKGRIAYAVALVAVAALIRDPFAVLIALATVIALALGGTGKTEDRGALAYALLVIAGLGAVLALGT
jgi:Zn-dependent protease